MFKNYRIVTYGELFSESNMAKLRQAAGRITVQESWKRLSSRGGDMGECLIVSSNELDDEFAKTFRERATQSTRLLVLQREGVSTDRLVSRIVNLPIRTSQRFFVMEASWGTGKSHAIRFVVSMLKRLASAVEANDTQSRILDTRIEDGILHVVSVDFQRMDVPISEIPELKKANLPQTQNYVIDEDGAFIYWPDLDLHLGWLQLQQIVDPSAARQALQKSEKFNIRYGKAVKQVREKSGLKPGDIVGLSEKQLGRIEKGACRLTANAIQALSKAHGLKPNEYLKKLAEILSNE